MSTYDDNQNDFRRPFAFISERYSFLGVLDERATVSDGRKCVANCLREKGESAEAKCILLLDKNGQLDNDALLKDIDGLIHFQIPNPNEKIELTFIYKNTNQIETTHTESILTSKTLKEISADISNLFHIENALLKYKRNNSLYSIPLEWMNDEYYLHKNQIPSNTLYVLASDKSLISFIRVTKDIDQIDVSGLARIGSGGFGQVFLAEIPKTKEKCALKVLSFPNDEKAQQILIREINLPSQCHHPCILPIFGYRKRGLNNETDKIVIVNKYESRGTLENYLNGNSKGMSQLQKIKTLYGIASAMKYLHEQDIIHRDLKPSNILFDDRDIPVVCDFGLSKQQNSDDSSASLSSQGAKGTYLYMAPEAFQGCACKASDVYSFAVIMYEIISKRYAFRNFKTAFEVYERVCRQNERPKLNDVEMSIGSQEMIEQCWSANKEDRWTFDKIVQTLEDRKFYSSFLRNEDDQDEYCEFLFSLNEEIKPFTSGKLIKRKDLAIQLYPFDLFVLLDAESKSRVEKAETNRVEQYNVGRSLIEGESPLMNGESPYINQQLGLAYLNESNKNGYFWATKYLVISYIQGIPNFLPKDLTQAHELIAHILVNENNQNYIAAITLQGKIEVAKGNNTEAKRYFQQGIEKHYPEAYCSYADLLEQEDPNDNRDKIDQYREIARNDFTEYDSITISKLDGTFAERDIQKAVEQEFGAIFRICISKQSAFVKFQSPEQLSSVIQKHQINLKGRTFPITKYRPRSKETNKSTALNNITQEMQMDITDLLAKKRLPSNSILLQASTSKTLDYTSVKDSFLKYGNIQISFIKTLSPTYTIVGFISMKHLNNALKLESIEIDDFQFLIINPKAIQTSPPIKQSSNSDKDEVMLPLKPDSHIESSSIDLLDRLLILTFFSKITLEKAIKEMLNDTGIIIKHVHRLNDVSFLILLPESNNRQTITTTLDLGFPNNPASLSRPSKSEILSHNILFLSVSSSGIGKKVIQKALKKQLGINLYLTHIYFINETQALLYFNNQSDAQTALNKPIIKSGQFILSISPVSESETNSEASSNEKSKVLSSEEPEVSKSPYAVYVMLPLCFTKDDLYEVFEDFDVSDIKIIPFDKEFQKVIIYLNNEEDYQSALDSQSIQLDESEQCFDIHPFR